MSRMRQLFRDAWAIARPYWFSEDRWAGRGLLVAVIALNLGIVFINVLLNKWNNAFYNSLQDKDYAAFVTQLFKFTYLAGAYIVAAVYQLYLNQMLQIRWRRWLTDRYLADWLKNTAYYRMQLHATETDNPDQRIAEDLRLFVSTTLGLSLGFLRAIVTLVSFVAILWVLSGPFTIPWVNVTVPGYMVWTALALRHRGHLAHQPHRAAARPAQLRPAALRGGLPLLAGALPRERGRAWRSTTARPTSCAAFASGSATWCGTGGASCASRSGSPPSPRATARSPSSSPSWSRPRATSAASSRSAGSCRRPRPSARCRTRCPTSSPRTPTSPSGARWWRGWRASTRRSTRCAPRPPSRASGTRRRPRAASISEHVHLALPDGRPLVEDISRHAAAAGTPRSSAGPRARARARSSAPSRASGPSAAGASPCRRRDRVLFLPQKPYLPLGTLREVVSYPTPPAGVTDAMLQEALEAVGLPQLGERAGRVGQLGAAPLARRAAAHRLRPGAASRSRSGYSWTRRPPRWTKAPRSALYALLRSPSARRHARERGTPEHAAPVPHPPPGSRAGRGAGGASRGDRGQP